MIVPMKRVFVVMQAKDAEEALKSLRDLGAIHLEHDRLPRGGQLDTAKADLAVLDQAIQIIANYPEGKKMGMTDTAGWREVSREIIQADDELEELILEDHEWQALIESLTPWGDFDPAAIRQLARQGVYARLCEVPAQGLDLLPADAVVETIARKGSILYTLVITRQPSHLPFPVVILPEYGLSQAREKREAGVKRINALKGQLKERAGVFDKLREARQGLADAVCFHEALNGMGQAATLMVLKGFCPVDGVGRVEEAARRHRWGLLTAEPSEEDRPPTLLRAPAWARLINPVYDFMGIMPGYREVDVSMPFLIFFSLFFGILVGDGGYGLLFLGLTFWAQKKAGRKVQDKTPFFLFYLLSTMTVIWGVLTGTFFGQTLFGTMMKPAVPWINVTENMQAICFMIGLVHLTLARVWRVVMFWPSGKAAAEIGWICFLFGGYFLTRMILLNAPFPAVGTYFLIAGAVLVVLFHSPGKNFGMTMIQGILSLPGATNMFMDLMSYIRLFAVGMASVTLADAFNEMALGIGFHNVFAGLGAAVILVLGHFLNIILALMGVFVHGVRLNVLEFSGHIGLEWQGNKYAPFAEKRMSV